MSILSDIVTVDHAIYTGAGLVLVHIVNVVKATYTSVVTEIKAFLAKF